MKRLLAALLVVAARPLLAECPLTWSQVPASGPGGRYSFGAAYHALSGQVVVFGGTDGANRNLGDTWGWDGIDWTQLASIGPQARKTASMAADTARGRLVLFGGSIFSNNRNAYFGETWEWDGARWEIRAQGGPSGRCCAAMAYDAARGRTVLFGGDVNGVAHADTWEWDGIAWDLKTPLTQPPSARHSHVMAYDPERRRVVLFGGVTAGGPSAETWEWDGARWTQRAVSGLSPRVRAAMEWDPASRALLLTGGEQADSTVWRLDGDGWHAIEQAGFIPRSGHALIADPRRAALVAFGGSTALGILDDTWERREPRDETRLVPIVLDVFGVGGARFKTELTLTNAGLRPLEVALHYTASLGARLGSGSVSLTLAAGEQRILPDAISYLREHGLPIPPASESQQGGTLRTVYSCASAPVDVAVLARTTSPTAPPLPVGAAGLAYVGLPPEELGSGPLVVDALRTSAADRSNVAVYNASAAPVTLRLTAVSGEGDGRRAVLAEALELPAWGFAQRPFADSGLANGWVVVERVAGNGAFGDLAGTGAFGAYGVVNDNLTNDGSFIGAVPAPASAESVLQVPVLVETPSFVSELVLTNRGEAAETLRLRYLESLAGTGDGTPVEVTLGPRTQRILPGALDELRRLGAGLAPAGPSFAGSLRVELTGPAPHEVSASARTASAGGSRFGLFTPAVAAPAAAGRRALLYALRSDEENRSNVALVNMGGDEAGPVELSVETHGLDPVIVSLPPGGWRQLDNFPGSSGLSEGSVEIKRISGTAPWLAYGVVNDGSLPGQRTGDGAYVPMLVPREPTSLPPAVLSVGGTYGVTVALMDNTCGSVTVQPQPTTVSHTVGAEGFVLTHGALSYRGSVALDGTFHTEPRGLVSGSETLTIGIEGRFLANGFEAVVTVSSSRNCVYHVRWTATKQGPPNVFP